MIMGKMDNRTPLHLTSKASSTPPSSLPSYTPTSLTDSEAPEQAPAHSQTQSFTTGFAVLLYNVGDVLGNLCAVCCRGELGRSLHTPLLLSPTPPSFTLDLVQVLLAISVSPVRVA
ncbi:hypothetical protein DFJ58DRAFT_824499 [Suillus subalutaceus]|uniref:uncharacterized protein n=1 Tax=Suillus subalutaceus TaxID=48586 RepID=UPI001B86E878|nr:uncharacterized protein DFJ58DRAFT_824499 [Suillus subalutaceus]KAG1830696.1 hypothetical protein DFJ58DRAFT_824499 [Suillus subalutaceus]